MPTVTLNRKVFEELVGKKLPEEELKERISMLGTDLEEVTKDEIVVEIFPNRPDLLSEQGFARAFSSFIGKETGLKEFKVKKSEDNFKVIIEKSVKAVRPYTAVAVVKNLDLSDTKNGTSEKIKEIIQIQEKLHITYGRNRKKVAIGIYPLDKIKMPIYFKAASPEKIKFKPLESEIEMTGKEILEQHKTGKEFAHLLEGKKVYPYFEDADGNILSMPPIINSNSIGRVTENTKEVFIECSGFDYNVLRKALNMIVTALSEMGGEIYSMQIIDESNEDKFNRVRVSPDLSPEKKSIDINYVNNLLGTSFTDVELKSNLQRMGYGFDSKTSEVLVPSYRADILHQVDFAEDIAIAYGYENIGEEIPRVATIAKESSMSKFQRKVAEILAGLGLIETKVYHITNSDNQTVNMNTELDLVKLANALNIEFNVMAKWTLPQLMEVLKGNRHREYPQDIFTISRVFEKENTKEEQLKNKTETGIIEKENLSVISCSNKSDFTKVKQIFDYLFRHIDLEYELKETQHGSFIPGRVAKIFIKNKSGKQESVGIIGEITPQALVNFGLEVPASGFEINLDVLLE